MSRTILAASAAALILGVSAVAIAQSGGDVRSNDRKTEKVLDHEKLTPIRPIRRVGPEDWPAGDPNNRADNLNKPKETTGQAAADSNRDQAKQQAQDPPKQDQAKQEPPKQQPNQQPANQQAQQQQQPAAANQQAQQQQQQNNQQQQQTNNQPAQNQPQSGQAQEQKKDNFASIRLGTDAQGRVAINDAQEKEISSALRKQRLRTTEVTVKVGAIAPPDVRLGAVSADIVAVLPQFRGYSFFATRDEIVIVEPTDKKIVALVPLNSSEIASRPEPERDAERGHERSQRNAERAERRERNASRSSAEAKSRRDSKRESVGAGIPSEEEILNAPVAGSSGRAQTRAEPDDGDTVVIERRPHRHRVFGIFRF